MPAGRNGVGTPRGDGGLGGDVSLLEFLWHMESTAGQLGVGRGDALTFSRASLKSYMKHGLLKQAFLRSSEYLT